MILRARLKDVLESELGSEEEVIKLNESACEVGCPFIRRLQTIGTSS